MTIIVKTEIKCAYACHDVNDQLITTHTTRRRRPIVR